VAGSIVTTVTPAHALFHLMMVTEVLAGTSTAPDAHFIEMQMYSADQRFLSSHEVAVFDATGEEVATFTFVAPVANGANQSHVLLATPQAEVEFGVTADLAITPELTAAGGSVCFRGSDGANIDCASWGSYSGDPADAGNPFSPTLGLLPGQSMTRVTSGGTDPAALDPGDDTNDSAADFGSATPSPTNNAGEGSGSDPDPDPEPQPEPIEHDRSVSLALRRALVAKGRVTAEGDYTDCFNDVAVRVQRRSGGYWRAVGRTRTDADGKYRVKVSDRAGRYRAVAPKFSPEEGHGCNKGVSPVRRNS
jgi:hypothetical protein